MTGPQSLIEHFSELEDPRVERNKKHELIDVIVLCAVVSGAEGWSDIEEFGLAKLKWLRRYVPLANGVAVDDTIARIISALSRLLHKSWHIIVTRTPTFRVANASQNSPCSIRPCHDCRPIASVAYPHRR